VMASLGVLADREHGRYGMTLARMRERLQAQPRGRGRGAQVGG